MLKHSRYSQTKDSSSASWSHSSTLDAAQVLAAMPSTQDNRRHVYTDETSGVRYSSDDITEMVRVSEQMKKELFNYRVRVDELQRRLERTKNSMTKDQATWDKERETLLQKCKELTLAASGNVKELDKMAVADVKNHIKENEFKFAKFLGKENFQTTDNILVRCYRKTGLSEFLFVVYRDHLKKVITNQLREIRNHVTVRLQTTIHSEYQPV